MDHRLDYVIGDFLASLLLGTIVGILSWAIVSPWWNMLVAMLIMMPIGMIAGLIAFFPAGIKLGAMEAMVPLMFTGMLSGMVVGMAAAMHALSFTDALGLGAASGVAGITFVWIANSLLRGITMENGGNARG